MDTISSMATHVDEVVNPRYIASLSDEPKQLLQPIEGYVHEPIVSLEEACELLHDIVPRLPTYIWIAKENSRNPPDGLTQDESAAIRLYTMEWDAGPNEHPKSLYRLLNETLRLVDRTKLRPWFRYLKLYLTALAKLPCRPHQTVWRGVRKDHSADYPLGEQVIWWAFSSCTTSLSVLESNLYLGNVGTRTLFSIETINARTISSHSHFTAEDEILLLPGTYFVVKSRLNPAPELHIIHLQQQVPPHPLLEPPFEGARLFPPTEQFNYEKPEPISNEKVPQLPWYKMKRFFFGIGISILLIILIVLLAVLLSRRKKEPEILPIQTSTFTMTTTQPSPNITIYNPVSIAYAFYTFDNNLLDLYGVHNGIFNNGSPTYVQGYVGNGYAISFDSNQTSWIYSLNSFNLGSEGFTIEAFIFLKNGSINGTLIGFSSGISLNIEMSRLKFLLQGSDTVVVSVSPLPSNSWHHIAVVSDPVTQYTTLFADGAPIGQLAVSSGVTSGNDNVTVKIGNGFIGLMDQLSISLITKTIDQILWDSSCAAYYPLDGTSSGWLLDHGPNGLNATSAGTTSTSGRVHYALSFPFNAAYYKANGFAALDIPFHEFSVSLWVQLGDQTGIVLTIANSMTCLFVLGIRNDSSIIAYLPNSTDSNIGVNIIGSSITKNQWTHIAFTWSNRDLGQLFINTIVQNSTTNATRLNNNSGSSMTVTLGMYRETGDCSGGNGLSTTQSFYGAVDELYIYTRQINQNEIRAFASVSS